MEAMPMEKDLNEVKSSESRTSSFTRRLKILKRKIKSEEGKKQQKNRGRNKTKTGETGLGELCVKQSRH
jgi:hypothetical protein